MDQPQNPAPFAVAPSLSPYLRPPASLALPTPKPIDRFLASTLVFDASNRVLLLRRSATAGWPLKWEIPGGGVEDSDESVLHAAARELREEAGLVATRFVACVNERGQVWGDDDPGKDWVWCRLAFLVEVEGGEVVLCEREHGDFVWAGEEEVKRGEAGGRELRLVSGAMKGILLEAFRAKGEMDRARTGAADGEEPGGRVP